MRRVKQFFYINSILQILLHILELNYYFINIFPDHENELKKINDDIYVKGRLSKEYHKIVQRIYNIDDYNNCFVNSRDFIDFLINNNISKSKIDANEFLSDILQILHTELNYHGDRKLKNILKCNKLIEKESFNFFKTVKSNLNLSKISYMFYGILKSRFTCDYCKKNLYNFQYFQYLNFSLFNFQGKPFNLYNGFKELIKSGSMSKYYCQNCKCLRNMKFENIIYSAPPYLIINIYYGKNKNYKPLKVSFGGIIYIKDFVDKYEKSPHISYELIAVISHIEDSVITYCKNYENKWYKFTYSTIIETAFDNIESNFPDILIYKKIKNN